MSPTSYAMTLREFREQTAHLEDSVLIMVESYDGRDCDVFGITPNKNGMLVLIKEHPIVKKSAIILESCPCENSI